MSAQREPIVNDFLAYLQEKQKLTRDGAMDLETAVQLSSWASTFTVDDFCAAKQVLCQYLGIAGTYVPHRRGDETGEKTLGDIKKILRDYEDRLPEFVKMGASLPSVSPEDVDVRSLLKDIVALKTSLAEVILKFDAAQLTIAELRNEVISLRNSAPNTRSAASSFKTEVRPGSCVGSRLRVADTATSVARAAPPSAPPPRARPPPVSKLRQRAYADVVTGQQVAADRVNSPSKAGELRAPSREMSSRTSVDKEGFTLVQRKSKVRRAPRKTLGGIAEPANSGLRVATPCKALYVSRLHYSAVADDVAEYVHRKTGLSLRVQQLRSRHYVHFSSFVVRVPRPLQDTIASPDFWPKGVVFRRFRGNLPNPTTPAQTTQRSHAVVSPKSN